eukprot:evm.model.NODE_46852_length_22811_cov_31.356846.3
MGIQDDAQFLLVHLIFFKKGGEVVAHKKRACAIERGEQDIFHTTHGQDTAADETGHMLHSRACGSEVYLTLGRLGPQRSVPFATLS